MQARIERVQVAEPLRPTLEIMAKTAQEAARDWTLQEHVGRVAATAPARDYVGQLRALYDDFTQRRWRYVMEPGERVPGTARALMGHVFGRAYNQNDRGPWVRGFGDCDDAATFIAGAALAMGMKPQWRVAQWPGGAHVSVVVETPRGERVSVDPVGYPDKPFGWALEPVGGSVGLYNVEGERNDMAGISQTWFAGPQHGIRVGRLRPHVVLRAGNDDRGARVLSMPLWAQRVFKRGLVVPRARAVDQYGEIYEYVAGWDAWAPVNGAAHNLRGVDASLDGRTERRAARRARRMQRKAARGKRQSARKARWKKSKIRGFFVKVRKAVGRVLRKISQSKIAKFFRKLKSKFLRSKLVQAAISTVLGAFGVPPAATRAVLEREAALADRGGRSTLAALVAEGKWGEAAKMVGGSFVDAGKKIAGGYKKIAANVGLSGYERESLAGLAESVGSRWVMEQGGRTWHVAPVAAMAGVAGAYFDGQLEVSETPESGRWYRIQPGDTLLGVVGDAFGLGPGAKRLKVAQWVNASAANACLKTTDISATEKKWFDGSRISFKPKFSCSREEQERCAGGNCYGLIWLAPAPGVEPPEAPIDEPEPEPEPEPIDEPDLPNVDDPEDTPPIEPPPAPPDEPDEPEPIEPEQIEPEPEPEPVGPVLPPEPDEPDVVDDDVEQPAEDPDEPEPDEPEPDEPEPIEPPPVVDLPDLEPPASAPSIAKGLGLLALLVALSEGRR